MAFTGGIGTPDSQPGQVVPGYPPGESEPEPEPMSLDEINMTRVRGGSAGLSASGGSARFRRASGGSASLVGAED